MDIIALQNWAYIPDLPDNIDPIRNLLLEYSKIPAKDIDSHILRVVSVEKTKQKNSQENIGYTVS